MALTCRIGQVCQVAVTEVFLNHRRQRRQRALQGLLDSATVNVGPLLRQAAESKKVREAESAAEPRAEQPQAPKRQTKPLGATPRRRDAMLRR